MGFFEKLRQNKEARDYAEAERIRLEREREKAVRKQRQAEQQWFETRKNQAQQFRDQSGVKSLIDEFRKLIGGSLIDVRLRKSRAEGSVTDSVVWDVSRGVYLEGGIYKYSGKLIVAETCPDGTIQFHGGSFGSSTIPFGQWRNNNGVLESALEKAYHNPVRYKWKIYPLQEGPTMGGWS